ncbi:MAG: hypothetical protein AMS17_11050 [Spirochaetes bacterium DG_61]|jgi:hypothetical protein|nr:MAG: hypothetical protein AMS17_11050 [Spirochaetes bacterium DG_61]
MRELYYHCPRFQKCSVNACPLDSYYPTRKPALDDLERKCKLTKSKRIDIHEKNKGALPYGGMTVVEYSRKQLWDSLPEQEKQKIIERGRDALKKVCEG